MALTLECEHAGSITLDAYVDWLQANVDFDDLESILRSAPMLRALANNRTFLSEYLAQSLASAEPFQVRNEYTSQTFVLRATPRFCIRANVWDPPAAGAPLDDIYSYHLLHDHNFSFMTVGYFGPGYETTLYEYDATDVRGLVGERVALRPLGRTSLPTGKVMFYRASRDVHRQDHPRETSISINLLLTGRGSMARSQYEFDARDGRIVRVLDRDSAARVGVCELARLLGDSRAATRLADVAARDQHPRVRAAALTSLAALDPAAAAGMCPTAD